MAWIPAAKTTRLRLLKLGHGGAASPGCVDRQDFVHHRRAPRRPARRSVSARAGCARSSRPSTRRTSMRAERVTDEYVPLVRELWTKDAPKVDGKYVKFSNIGFEPKPVQKPRIGRSGVGGERPPALRPSRAPRRRLVSDRDQPAGSARHPDAAQGPGAAPHQDDRGQRRGAIPRRSGSACASRDSRTPRHRAGRMIRRTPAVCRTTRARRRRHQGAARHRCGLYRFRVRWVDSG